MKIRTAIPAALLAITALSACNPVATIQRLDTAKRIVEAPHTGPAPQAPGPQNDDSFIRPSSAPQAPCGCEPRP